jgi:hypothetical protein
MHSTTDFKKAINYDLTLFALRTSSRNELEKLKIDDDVVFKNKYHSI